MRNGGNLSPAIAAPTYGELARMANPQSAGQPETLRYWLYDTELYTSGTTRELTLFRTTKQDRSLSNMQNAGSLPDPQYFAIDGVMVDIFADDGAFVTTSATQTGLLDDIGRLILASRGTFEFSMNDKVTGPFPLSLTRGTGGPTGFGWGTFTAEESLQYGNNGIFDGGARFDRALIIPPVNAFTWTLKWPAAVTLTGDVYVRLTMSGILSRKVA